MKLCESVDVLSGSAKVKPGATAHFAIWLSASGADAGGVTVNLATSPTAAAPNFTVCPSGHKEVCKISTLGSGQTLELQAAVVVPKSSADGTHVRLTAKMTSTRPPATVKAFATVRVAVPASPTPASPTPASPTPARSSTEARAAAGTTATTPGYRTGTLGLSQTSLPLVNAGPVTSSPATNIGSLLPSIPPATPTPVQGTGHAANGSTTAPAASIGPLDRRMVGTQLIALAALCAAIGIVIAKLALRTPRPVPGAAQAAAGKPSPSGTAGATASGGGTAGPSGPSGTALAEGPAGGAAAARDSAQAPGSGPEGIPGNDGDSGPPGPEAAS